MKKQLDYIWKSRTPGDRKIISAFSIILVIFAYTGFVISAERSGSSLRTSVITLRAQSADIDKQALEYNHLQNTPSATSSPTDLYTLVETQVDNSDLSKNLLRMDMINNNQVVTVFDAIVFSDWLKLIIALKLQNIRVVTCRIEAMSTPGFVNMTATLVRTQ